MVSVALPMQAGPDSDIVSIEVENANLSFESNNSQDDGNRLGKKRRKNRRCRRNRSTPYWAKNSLGRPKINAPANTTQFLFEDKELGLNTLFCSDNESSEQENSINTSSEASGYQNEETISGGTGTPNYEGLALNEDMDKFHEEQFDRMYEDIRAEMLRQESAETLTSRCMELETAIHNMEFLLHKETERRRQLEEIVFLTQQNGELELENSRLCQATQETSPDSSCVQQQEVSSTC